MKHHSILSISKMLAVLALSLYGSAALAQTSLVTQIELASDAVAVDPILAGQEFWQKRRTTDGDPRDGQFTRDMTGGLDPIEFERQLIGGWSTHPAMFYQLLPFNWDVTFELPLINILPNLPEHSRPGTIRLGDVARIFNIEVILADHFAYELPASASLIAELRFEDRAFQIEIPMVLNETESRFYMANAQDFIYALLPYFENRPIVSPENPKPDFELREFQGFRFDESTVVGMHPLGIPVAYNVNLGATTVKSGFQWGGKPEGMPLRYPQLPFLTP